MRGNVSLRSNYICSLGWYFYQNTTEENSQGILVKIPPNFNISPLLLKLHRLAQISIKRLHEPIGFFNCLHKVVGNDFLLGHFP